MFVYSPETVISWPDPNLGVLSSQTDPNFLLPGNIGREQSEPERLPRSELALGGVSTRDELQVGALYMAHDYIKYTPGAGPIVCSKEPIIEKYPGSVFI